MAIDRPEIIKVKDLTIEEIEVFLLALASIDLDEYYVDQIVEHKEKGKNRKNWKFKVRWVGNDP